MKKKAIKLPDAEQLATLTARLVGAGIIPRLNDPTQMFRAALNYWRHGENFLRELRENAAGPEPAGVEWSTAEVAGPVGVPKPAVYPVGFQWLLDNLFESSRDLLRDYLKFCQARKTWPAGDVESFIEPLLEGTDVEGFHWLIRRWPEWRQARSAAPKAGKKSGKSSASRKQPSKKVSAKGRR